MAAIKAGTAYVDIQGDFHQFDKDVDNTSKSFKSKMGKAFKVGGMALAAGIGIGAVAVKGFIKAAQEAEVSQAKMRTQLKASGLSYKTHAKAIDEAIQKTSELAGIDDEELQDAFTNIVRVTGDVNKSLDLTAVAADIARAKHMDVAKAGELVGKVAGGNTGILKRYGIMIDKGATSTEALAFLQKKFAGQAEAYGNTAAGAQERFGVATENLQETLGKALLPTFTDVANALASFTNGMMTGTGTGGAFIKIVTDIGRAVGKELAGPFENVKTAWAALVSAWPTIGAVLRALAPLLALAVIPLRIIGVQISFLLRYSSSESRTAGT